jgi:hypothetical protein
VTKDRGYEKAPTDFKGNVSIMEDGMGRSASVFPVIPGICSTTPPTSWNLEKFYYMFGYNRHDFGGFVDSARKELQHFSKLDTRSMTRPIWISLQPQ